MNVTLRAVRHSLRPPLQSPVARSLAAYGPGRRRRVCPGEIQLRHFSACPCSADERGQTSAKELDNYFDDLTKLSPSTPPGPSTTTTSSSTSTRDETAAKARVVFGSRLAGPAERRRELDASSRLIAGVLVPPRPDEPDNCCMSGCVNCVWDQYRDELEEWAAKSAEAKGRLEAKETNTASGVRTRVEEGREESGRKSEEQGDTPTHVATSMDDDGGGSEALWGSGGEDMGFLDAGNSQDLFQGVPVGIREFMRNEKRLKERKAASAAATAA